MLNRTIVLNPVEPALLSMRSAAGIDLDLGITFLAQNQTPVDPDALRAQLIILPRSAWMMAAYDVVTASAEAGIGNVSIPGTALYDPAGYTIELYQRREAVNPADPPVPTGLIAKGVLRLDGTAYAPGSSLSPIVVPVVIGPQGPVGPQGEPGERGSMWFTGDGDPTETAGKIDGDMYLNNLNGDVWRFVGDVWLLGVF